ncbi:glycosyltransferase [Candidatus Saccharibacteria bacterium]|nr:glycosyltransferase [Candidatus Saccharibacteria bacterium]
MGIEQKANNVLRRFPVIKKIAKRIYQGTFCVISKKPRSEGIIERVTPNDRYEYFFGYYDKSPWDSSGRYMLCLRAMETSKNVAPKEPADIVLIDTRNNNSINKLATTHSWNVQQGCMAGWLGPDFKSKIFYNDFRDGKYCGVVLDLKTKRENVYDMPFYTVSDDGKIALTLDFARLHRLRPGYGYSNLEDKTKGENIPDGPCVWRINMYTKEITPILTYKQLYDFEHRPEMEKMEHKVNHLMLSPNGERFMVIHRWLKGGKKFSRLLTCDIDGKNLYNLSDDDMVSHCYWKNNNEIIAYCRKGKTDGYYLVNDKSKDYDRKWDFLTMDGHPSYSPDKKYVVTDTYPDRNRISTVRVLGDNTCIEVAKVESPFKYDNDTRCDLHPRWSRDGDKICFDGCFEGKRGLYVINNIRLQLPHTLINPEEIPKEATKGLVSCVIPSYKRSDTLKRAIDSVLNQSYKKIEVLIVDDNEKGDEWDRKLKRLMKTYADARVRLIVQPVHINGAVARNYGIKEAKGEFIAFLDDDDEWEKDKIEKQLELLRKEKADVVSCLWIAYKNGKEIRRCQKYSTEDIQFKILSRAVSIYTSTVLIKRSSIYEFGGFDETLKRHQDLQFLVDAAEDSKFVLLDEYKVKLHTDSEINKPDTKKLIEIKKAFLNREQQKIKKYSKKEQKRIKGAHEFELLYSSMRDKDVLHMLNYGCKVCMNFPAINDVVERIKERRK